MREKTCDGAPRTIHLNMLLTSLYQIYIIQYIHYIIIYDTAVSLVTIYVICNILVQVVIFQSFFLFFCFKCQIFVGLYGIQVQIPSVKMLQLQPLFCSTCKETFKKRSRRLNISYIDMEPELTYFFSLELARKSYFSMEANFSSQPQHS